MPSTGSKLDKINQLFDPFRPRVVDPKTGQVFIERCSPFLLVINIIVLGGIGLLVVLVVVSVCIENAC